MVIIIIIQYMDNEALKQWEEIQSFDSIGKIQEP